MQVTHLGFREPTLEVANLDQEPLFSVHLGANDVVLELLDLGAQEHPAGGRRCARGTRARRDDG